jgi:hypothetical protein
LRDKFVAMIDPFSDEQYRLLTNLEQRYRVWMDAERALRELPYDLRRKEVGGRAYLYEINDRGGNGKSLGPWSTAAEEKLEQYRARKSEAKGRREASRTAVNEACRLYRALRLPMLATEAGAILREADRRRLLGESLLIVGTNAMIAYAVEAGGFIREAPDETQDFDLAWTAIRKGEGATILWDMLKAVDPTFTVNTERTFQARNAQAYEVEVLVAPSRAGTMAGKDKPHPIPLAEQEWLLNGAPVDRVVACRDGLPARIVAPDPRWFALQKLWMSKQTKRNPLKRKKDAKQGLLLLDAVEQTMPQYPLDAGFAAALPPELVEHFAAWRAQLT